MLRIRIELVPFGNEEEAREIAQGIIYNDGSGDHVFGNYVYALCENNRYQQMGEVFGHYRPDSVWALLAKAMMDYHFKEIE